MSKQNAKIYSSLMDMIAISMAVGQGIRVILGSLIAFAEPKLTAICDPSFIDMLFKAAECLVYFLGLVVPMNIFIKMNKNAEKEIYEPVKTEKVTVIRSLVSIGFFLGLIILSSFINSFLVGSLGNYNDFSSNVLWAAELDHAYQIIFYIALRVILPAFLEEYFFRGMVCKSLSVYGKGTAILASAALFSMMHADFSQMLYSFVAGVLLGFLYLESENIAYPILLHLINNGIFAAGNVIRAQLGSAVYDGYMLYAMAAISLVFLICAAVFIVITIKKGELIDKLVLKPDENGDPVSPLSARERVSGFFSRGVVLYLSYAIFRAIYLIYLGM